MLKFHLITLLNLCSEPCYLLEKHGGVVCLSVDVFKIIVIYFNEYLFILFNNLILSNNLLI